MKDYRTREEVAKDICVALTLNLRRPYERVGRPINNGVRRLIELATPAYYTRAALRSTEHRELRRVSLLPWPVIAEYVSRVGVTTPAQLLSALEQVLFVATITKKQHEQVLESNVPEAVGSLAKRVQGHQMPPGWNRIDIAAAFTCKGIRLVDSAGQRIQLPLASSPLAIASRSTFSLRISRRGPYAREQRIEEKNKGIAEDVAALLNSTLTLYYRSLAIDSLVREWSVLQQKDFLSLPWSENAWKASSKEGVVRDHLIPVAVQRLALLEMAHPDCVQVYNYLAYANHVCVVSRAEDLALRAAGYNATMPEGWQVPEDRYAVVAIKLLRPEERGPPGWPVWGKRPKKYRETRT